MVQSGEGFGWYRGASSELLFSWANQEKPLVTFYVVPGIPGRIMADGEMDSKVWDLAGARLLATLCIPIAAHGVDFVSIFIYTSVMGFRDLKLRTNTFRLMTGPLEMVKAHETLLCRVSMVRHRDGILTPRRRCDPKIW